jgi:hypothetical protein
LFAAVSCTAAGNMVPLRAAVPGTQEAS